MTRVIKIGDKKIGGDNPVLIQSMTNVDTADVDAVVKQINELENAGCEIIRASVYDEKCAKAFKENKKIMLVIDLEPWEIGAHYDRLGLEHETIRFFDTDVHHIKIPISEGRNVASLVEVAALNARLKYMGVNSAKEFTTRLDEELKRKNKLKE